MSEISLQTLVLTQGYEPLKVVSWQRAITLLFLDKVEVIEEHDHDIKSTYLVIKIPAVVRLLSAFRRHRKRVKFNRANIFARDRYRCQYCGDKGKMADLTYDHVIPRSRGGKTEWNNIATSCYSCNNVKGNRTPSEAGMKLQTKPKQPTWVPSMMIRINRESAPNAWKEYLWWTSPLDE